MGAPEHHFSGDRDNRAKQLIKLRQSRYWSQQEFADLVGCSKSTVYSWERGDGKSTLSDKNIMRICEELARKTDGELCIDIDFFDKQCNYDVLYNKKKTAENENVVEFNQKDIKETACVGDKFVIILKNENSHECIINENEENIIIDDSMEWGPFKRKK